jgi:aryl-alcohol dehydrogenase-like predicted oxidoreductase
MFTTLSGQEVSRFSFGCMQFGGGADEATSGAMYAACREAGINFFDTAFGYTEGKSETYLGRLIAGERDDVFVATKCAYTGGSAEEISTQFAESRKRLGIDVVDLLYLHRFDDEVPLEESLGALAGLVADGVVRYVGVSNYASWQVMKARHMARGLGFDITFLQPMYNLVKRQVEVELLPMAISEGFAVCPYSPLGGGLLTGKYASGGTGRLKDDERYAARYAPEWMGKTAADLAAIADEIGVVPATLAVAWAARHPGVYGPIISAKSVEQLRPSLAAISFDMDDALYARISALSPTPPPATDRLEEA